MKTLQLLLITFVGIAFATTPAWAVSLNANIDLHENVVKPRFVFSNTVFIEYPDGGEVKQNLRGKDLSLKFSADSDTPGVSELMSKLNHQLSDSGSTAKIINLDIHYEAKIRDGREDLSIVEYSLVLTPTLANMTNFMPSDNSMLIDSKWRSFFVNGSVVIDTDKYGKYDINNPLSLFENLSPVVYQILVQNRNATLNFPMIDARDLSMNLSGWQLGCDSGVYYGHVLTAPSVFRMETDNYNNAILLMPPVKSQTKFTADKTYHVIAYDDGSSAEISIDGHARPYVMGNTEYLKLLPLVQNQIDQNKDVFGATSYDCTEKLTVQPTVSKSDKQLSIKTILADARGIPLSNVAYEIRAEQDNHVILQYHTTDDITTHTALIDSDNPVDITLTVHNQTNHGLRGTFDFQMLNNSSIRIVKPTIAVFTNKESYTGNDQIIIRGHTYNIIGPQYTVSFAFQDPRGYYVYRNNSNVGEDGAFDVIINPKKDYSQSMGNNSWARGGNYTLSVGTPGQQSKTNFYFSGFTPREQLKLGTSSHFVKCPTGFDLVTRARDGYPSCILSSNLSRLVENNWTEEKFARASNSNYTILYLVSNGTLEGMQYDPKAVSITLSINAKSDGKLWLTVTRPFSSDDIDGNDITYFVKEDGQDSYDSFADKGETKTTITIPFKNGVKTIQISRPCYGGC